MGSRRSFLHSAFGVLPAKLLAAAPVTIGVQSYSFRDRPLDAALDAMSRLSLRTCELWQVHVEPQKVSREELRKWRETVPLREFQAIAEKFRARGVKIIAYNYSFRDDFSDRETARGFEMAKALGATALTASANVDQARRINGFAQKAGMRVGMHNHDSMKKNEFSTPEDFATALDGNPNIAINLDIGHFVAAGFDPVSFIGRHADRIVTLHIKDRKKNHGDDVPFGQGDTPIREVLQLLRQKRYGIPAMIEYEYKGGDTVTEVGRCYTYCQKALRT